MNDKECNHSFSVDASCGNCGLMISEIMRKLESENADLKEELASSSFSLSHLIAELKSRWEKLETEFEYLRKNGYGESAKYLLNRMQELEQKKAMK